MYNSDYQHDFILKQIEMFTKSIRAILNRMSGKEEQQREELKQEKTQLDSFLEELTGLNDAIFEAQPGLLIGLLKNSYDENKKAMICIALYLKDREYYKKVYQTILCNLNIHSIDKNLQKLLFETIGKKTLEDLISLKKIKGQDK